MSFLSIDYFALMKKSSTGASRHDGPSHRRHQSTALGGASPPSRSFSGIFNTLTGIHWRLTNGLPQ
jgi:hypothetical protein